MAPLHIKVVAQMPPEDFSDKEKRMQLRRQIREALETGIMGASVTSVELYTSDTEGEKNE